MVKWDLRISPSRFGDLNHGMPNVGYGDPAPRDASPLPGVAKETSRCIRMDLSDTCLTVLPQVHQHVRESKAWQEVGTPEECKDEAVFAGGGHSAL